jgi:glutamate dehydrogenase
VEGANLFITDGAREALFRECGLPIVKDSSANKCGVICSSYEINCSMLLDETEFINEKERIVGDVLQRLRSRAQSEAELLFREFRNLPGALPHFSKRISNAINTLTDAIAACLPDQYSFEAKTGSDHVEEDFGDDEHEYMSGSVGAAAAGELRAAENAAVCTNAPRHLDDLLHLVHENLPEKVVEMGGHRLCEKVPKAYMKYAIASTLASKLVYQEGVEFVEKHKSDERLAALAFDFLEAEGAVAGLVDLMERLDWMELDNEDDAGVGAEDGAGQAFDRDHAKETAMKIVRRGGVRAYLAENRYTK